MLAFVLLALVVLVGGGLVYRAQGTARSAKIDRTAPQADESVHVEPPPPSVEPPPPPTFMAESPPSASAPKKPAATAPAAAGAAAPAPSTGDPSKTGILDTTALPPGRKIVVDGRLLGTSPRRVAVSCGMHRIKIGDLEPENLQLPCGGEITFTE